MWCVKFEYLRLQKLLHVLMLKEKQKSKGWRENKTKNNKVGVQIVTLHCQPFFLSPYSATLFFLMAFSFLLFFFSTVLSPSSSNKKMPPFYLKNKLSLKRSQELQATTRKCGVEDHVLWSENCGKNIHLEFILAV